MTELVTGAERFRPTQGLLLRSAAGCLVGIALLACAEDGGYESPSPHTSPTVTLPYPHYYLEHISPNFEPVTFGTGSADISVTIIGQEDEGRDHAIDFALPARTSMQGYGAFEGFTETFRRTRMLDSHGIHGVRIAVYRTDTERGHTNMWSHFLARSEGDGILLTEQTEWDWIGGEENTSGFSSSAWPFYGDLQRSHYFYDSFFGFSPGVYSRTEFIRQVIVSTVATSPTHGIEGCVQVLFNAIDPALRHQAFLHERYGLVEIVYRWFDLDSVGPNDYPLVPRDGFAIAPEELVEIPEPPTTYNDVAGSWHGVAEMDDGEGTLSQLDFRLEISPTGTNYREPNDMFDVEGTYSDGEVAIHMKGRYERDETYLTMISGRSYDDVSLVALYYPDAGADGQLGVRLYRRIGDGAYSSGTAALLRE